MSPPIDSPFYHGVRSYLMVVICPVGIRIPLDPVSEQNLVLTAQPHTSLCNTSQNRRA